MQFPKNEDDWKCIASLFEDKWNFPNCLGAIDGKHVQITPPPNSGSYYYNYKGTHSLVLMAIVNANYEFILCDFGTNGRVSDGGVIENTLFYEKLKNGKLSIPEQANSKNSSGPLPYVFVGDEAFALRSDFLKPFAQKELNKEKRVFNYRLSRARRIVENVFGILASKFRIFHTPINLKIENIEKVVMTCCVLHNFLRKKCGDNYIPVSHLYTEDTQTGVIQNGLTSDDSTFVELQRSYNRHAADEAKTVRNKYMNYFNNEGAVGWQESFL